MMKTVVRRVLLTEKGSRLATLNQYFLEVDRKASKPEIRAAVEAKFGVHVLAVRTANIKGGLRTVRGTRMRTTEPAWKRAIVEVKPGERIETL